MCICSANTYAATASRQFWGGWWPIASDAATLPSSNTAGQQRRGEWSIASYTTALSSAAVIVALQWQGEWSFLSFTTALPPDAVTSPLQCPRGGGGFPLHFPCSTWCCICGWWCWWPPALNKYRYQEEGGGARSAGQLGWGHLRVFHTNAGLLNSHALWSTQGCGSGSAWIRIHFHSWIRFRIQYADPDPGG